MKKSGQFDILRIISAFAIVMLHVSCIWMDAYVSTERFGEVYEDRYLITCILHVITRFGVPCFVMLAGAFSLDNEKNRDYSYYYSKIMKTMYIPFCIVTVFYVLKCLLPLVLIRDLVGIKNLFIRSIKGEPYYHLWYMFTIFFVYLLVPVIIRLKESVSERAYIILAVTLTVLGCVSNLTSTHSLSWDIGKSSMYLGYFLLGDAIKRKMSHNPVKALLCVLSGLFVLLATAFFVYKLDGRAYYFDLCDPLAPNIVLASVLIFCGFSFMQINKRFKKMSSVMYGVYLWHPLVIDFLFKKGFINNRHSNVVEIILFSLVSFWGAFVIAVVFSKAYNLVENISNKQNRE